MGPRHPHYTLYIAHKMNPKLKVWVLSEKGDKWLRIESPLWLSTRRYVIADERPTCTSITPTTRSM